MVNATPQFMSSSLVKIEQFISTLHSNRKPELRLPRDHMTLVSGTISRDCTCTKWLELCSHVHNDLKVFLGLQVYIMA
ncbi:hypothetical protein DPMN_182251 [Dreissena polymorpha]|uniref:Uncharacterized protein n=1 Tax=Dreissena polymorpha TaxID=45954 RepID=A0A9D4I4H5_DREPO|nr:hypothetical protein DPMN_182251 [Dreissena polymorpha]